MTHAIAIVGIACEYPDARTPDQLWQNILAQRRAFRRFPSQRLNLGDYHSDDRSAPDRTYGKEAALIEGYQFDRVRFRVGGNAYRSADLAHWLALDVASRALADAGCESASGLPKLATGVILGNTLTGEFSRASVMRLRWPFVRRVADSVMRELGLGSEARQTLVERIGERFKAPFAPIGEDSLAGGLANTIAGRICNYFDLGGGGYTVDGACSSSLLAVSTACNALAAGEMDAALAGGVDLSLDPFEMVGFAKAGALSAEDMRIYDQRPAGFLPGEGCGMLVLMRHADALAQGKRIYALIKGWGVASDGAGGLTRPEVEGQLLALRRAYRHAGFGPESVGYFEGHGTGTAVGDACELQVLSRARREADPQAPPVAVGSIKANIGHTKAAAGVAGLIKAVLAVHHRIVPPTTGCETPHKLLSEPNAALRVLPTAEAWPTGVPARAGVSSMGFGGINAHIVVEGPQTPRSPLSREERTLLRSAQDAEVLLMDAEDSTALLARVEQLLELAPRLARAEVADLAAHLAEQVGRRRCRAAVVAKLPEELAEKLSLLRGWLIDGQTEGIDMRSGIFLGAGERNPRIGFLFPGQGAPAHLQGGAWARRFEVVQALYAAAKLPTALEGVATEVVQPAIVTASLAGLTVLERLGIRADIAAGHSLGELAALHWGGALAADGLLRLAAARGRAMGEVTSVPGAMASLRADHKQVEPLLIGTLAVIAGFNSPQQTVVSGPVECISQLVERCLAIGLEATPLRVSHAFHSPLVASAGEALGRYLEAVPFGVLARPVASTVTGDLLSPLTDLQSHLVEQLTAPVHFIEAAQQVADGADLLIEVGPGRIMAGLASDFLTTPVISLDASGPSLTGLLSAVGAAFALGTPINTSALFGDRFVRPFALDKQWQFFANPCELAPQSETSELIQTVIAEPEAAATVAPTVEAPDTNTLALVRRLVAERAELPTEAVQPQLRMLSDLHLNSITVSQLVAEAARQMGIKPPTAPGDYADASVEALAAALDELAMNGSAATDLRPQLPDGIDAWVRPFTVALVEAGRPFERPAAYGGQWQLFASPEHPLANQLQARLAELPGTGVLVCIDGTTPPVEQLLAAAHAALADPTTTHFVLLQHNGSCAGLARTLHLESPRLICCVLDLPFNAPQAPDWVISEVRAAFAYSEVHFDLSGKRYIPVLKPLPTLTAHDLPLGPQDVLLVSGGGKGIASECALALTSTSGARLVLLGRSQPETDRELAANLDRFAQAGIDCCYLTCDVTDPSSVKAAIDTACAAFGPITALLHSAGTNTPQLLPGLTAAGFARTLAPKVRGLENLLAAIDPQKLRLLVTFGSIIARTGMAGNADYSVANAWLTQLTEQWQVQHPHCRCLAAEWSVWSGLGMGERLGRIDALLEQGITPIPPAVGVEWLRQLISCDARPTAVVIAGRFGQPPTLRFEEKPVPFRRFLERVRVYYPGVELITDADLTSQGDPYVVDHQFGGERLFPAVMGLEGMAQVAMTLQETESLPVFEQVEFLRPVVVPSQGSRTIRIVALKRDADLVEVALRSEDTGFATDHFRALCRFSDAPRCESFTDATALMKRPRLDLEAEQLYGGILFHSGRFRRLRGYQLLKATECFAEITRDTSSEWFSRLLPDALVLGDPGARDTALHGIQACIPHATLLPVGVDRVLTHCLDGQQPMFLHARERNRLGNLFTYDLEVLSAEGQVLEVWQGLRLQLMAGAEFQGAWPAPLLAPYIERRVQELNPGLALTVAIEQGNRLARRQRSNLAIAQASGSATAVLRRPDGKPEIPGSGLAVSAAHAGDLTLAVAGDEALGCDIEVVASRSTQIWQDLLGADRYALAELIAGQAGSDVDSAFTRVWSAVECLKKAGVAVTTPLTFLTAQADGWVVLAAGKLLVATFVAPVRHLEQPLALAILGPRGGKQADGLPCLNARFDHSGDAQS